MLQTATNLPDHEGSDALSAKRRRLRTLCRRGIAAVVAQDRYHGGMTPPSWWRSTTKNCRRSSTRRKAMESGRRTSACRVRYERLRLDATQGDKDATDAAFREADVMIKSMDGQPPPRAQRDGAARRRGELRPGSGDADPLVFRPRYRISSSHCSPVSCASRSTRSALSRRKSVVASAQNRRLSRRHSRASGQHPSGKPVKWIEISLGKLPGDDPWPRYPRRGRTRRAQRRQAPGQRIKIIADIGAYQQLLTDDPDTDVANAPGLYKVPPCTRTLTEVYTNKTPTDAYRGAGRPEAILLY